MGVDVARALELAVKSTSFVRIEYLLLYPTDTVA